MVESTSETHLDRSSVCSYGIYVIPGYFRLNLVLNPGIIKQVTHPTLPPKISYIVNYAICMRFEQEDG